MNDIQMFLNIQMILFGILHLFSVQLFSCSLFLVHHLLHLYFREKSDLGDYFERIYSDFAWKRTSHFGSGLPLVKNTQFDNSRNWNTKLESQRHLIHSPGPLLIITVVYISEETVFILFYNHVFVYTKQCMI